MIDGGFWLQQTRNDAEALVRFADVLAPTPAGRPGVVLTPANSPRTLRGLYERARGQGEAFLDPCGHFMDLKPSSKARASNFPWLDSSYTRPTTTAAWRTWMRLSLDHQLSAGFHGSAPAPAIIVTPSPYLQATAHAQELYGVLDAALDERDATAGGHECWIGVTVDREFLRTEAHLTRLANAIVSLNVPGIVFRSFQSELAPLSDRRFLEGMREVVSACASNGIAVLLPNDGWTGWLAMSWGAHGFSGGFTKSSWYDRTPGPLANVPRYERIFETQLLRHVRWEAHEELTLQSGYTPCWCDSCRAMAGTWDADEAGRHQIRVAHENGATLRTLPTADRAAAVRAQIDAGIVFRDSLPPQLRNRVQAGFLDTWRSLV